VGRALSGRMRIVHGRTYRPVVAAVSWSLGLEADMRDIAILRAAIKPHSRQPVPGYRPPDPAA